jgi:hypothetical protein
MEVEAKARAENEARVAAEQRALEAAKERARAEAEAAQRSESMSVELMKEKAEAEAIAQDLIERMMQQGDELDDWRFRAETVLSEAPIPVTPKKGARQVRKVAAVLAGLTVFAGAVGVGTLTWAGAQGNAGMVAVAAPVMQPAAAAVAKPMPSPAPQFSSKLQMSYVLAALPSTSQGADSTVAAATSRQ